MPRDARAEALTALSQFLVDRSPMGETLTRIAAITTGALPAAEFAGIALLDDGGRPTTALYTDAESPEIDEAQYEAGRGPCLDAWRTKQVIRLDDTDASAAYPEFGCAARANGIRSTLSLPLVVHDEGIGALNLYARVPGGFSDDDEALGADLSTTASVVLANASAYWTAAELNQQLSEAMASRAVIEQAKGILMGRDAAITADGAFALLRAASQRENVKLRDIAQRVVDRRA